VSPLNYTVLTQAFEENFSLPSPFSEGDKLLFTAQTIGDLVLPSGRIIACDAFFVGLDSTPYSVHAPPGHYPVVLSVVTYRMPRTRHPGLFWPEKSEVALAMLKLRDELPVRWEIAVGPGQDARNEPNDHIIGYPVESGTGSLTSVEAGQLAVKHDYSETLLNVFESDPSKLWVIIALDEKTGVNVVAFSSNGDGRFTSYFGFDTENRPVRLVTDFGWVHSEKAES